MTKHAKKSPRLQAVERLTAATVQIPLPVLGAFASIERSYFDLCIRAGQQVLAAMMEQDRTELCGPRWKRDPDRRAGRAGTAPSEVTLGGRRIQMTRPRVRSQAGQEVELPSFAKRWPVSSSYLSSGPPSPHVIVRSCAGACSSTHCANVTPSGELDSDS